MRGTLYLESAEKIFDYVESSCRNGVCTTCAGQVMKELKIQRQLSTDWASPKSRQALYAHAPVLSRGARCYCQVGHE